MSELSPLPSSSSSSTSTLALRDSGSSNRQSEPNFNIDAFLGFLAPLPFASPLTALVNHHYGTRYHELRVRLEDVVHIYAMRFGGLRGVDAAIERYDAELLSVNEAVKEFVDEARTTFERINGSAARTETPAVEFSWCFIEPAIMFNDHCALPDYDADDEAGRKKRDTRRHGTPDYSPRDMQAEYTPPPLATFISPSLVFELCCALTLRAAVELRLLERERRRDIGALSAQAIEPLVGTLKELRGFARLYVTVPACESRGYLHPLIVAEHFIERALAPFIYAQALMMTTDMRLATSRNSSNTACLKAALFNMSAELIVEDVCRNMPPLLCSSMQRVMLKTLAEDRKSAAYLNIAGALLRRASAMAAEAATDANVGAKREDCLQAARALIEQARTMSDETALAARADQLYQRVRAALPDTPAIIRRFETPCWPVAACLRSAREDKPLDARSLMKAAAITQRCSVEIDDENESVTILLVDSKQ